MPAFLAITSRLHHHNNKAFYHRGLSMEVFGGKSFKIKKNIANNFAECGAKSIASRQPEFSSASE